MKKFLKNSTIIILIWIGAGLNLLGFQESEILLCIIGFIIGTIGATGVWNIDERG